ncbi:hypothetical protein DL93DRAFT_1519680 [Clavulina sp. PMI_390]|nr:hypothetical protein DL93DRAFT_1519680 [Clavulina sp. PMI_390]
MHGQYHKSLATAKVPAATTSISFAPEDQLWTNSEPPSGMFDNYDLEITLPSGSRAQAQAPVTFTTPHHSIAPVYSTAHPPPPHSLPNDPPVELEGHSADLTAAFSNLFTIWAHVVHPFSHRYQTQLTPHDVASLLRRGGSDCILQASFSASNLWAVAQSGFENRSRDAVADVIEYQAAVACHLQQFLLTRSIDASVLVNAVFGVDFSLLLGGRAGWKGQLDIACSWVIHNWYDVANGRFRCPASSMQPLTEQLLAHSHLGTFGPAAVAFVGIVVWYDILGALAQRRPLVLKDLVWEILASESPVQMPTVMGCTNRVMLVLAQTASLASLVRSGVQLNIKQLIPYIRAIKNVFTPSDLPVCAPVAGVVSPNTPSSSLPSPPGASYYEMDTPLMAYSTGFPRSSSTTNSEFTEGSYPPLFDSMDIPAASFTRWSEHVHSVKDVTHAFCMAGNVHLQAIILEYSQMVDNSPFTPLASVMNLEHAASWGARVLNCIPANDADRSIVWPLCVIGSAAQDAADRAWFVERFGAIEGREVLGNVQTAQELMCSVWDRQDRTQREALKAGRSVGRVYEPDWIDCMDGRPVLLA